MGRNIIVSRVSFYGEKLPAIGLQVFTSRGAGREYPAYVFLNRPHGAADIKDSLTVILPRQHLPGGRMYGRHLPVYILNIFKSAELHVSSTKAGV
jgi:hypothetical protein